jgi:hypothetical protein
LEEIVVETAQSKAQHQALANYYAGQAADARKLANRHKGMSRAYLGSKGGNTQPMGNHCKKIADQQEAMAKEYDALAKLHEDEAAKAK